MNNTLDPTQIGKKLALLRGEKTRREVSTALGISESALAMYEAGERIPRDNVKIRIADYYGKTVSWIFF